MVHEKFSDTLRADNIVLSIVSIANVMIGCIVRNFISSETNVLLKMYHHHHHVAPSTRISLTLSRHSSLSTMASRRSSRLPPVKSQCCCMYVLAEPPAFVHP